MCAEDSMRCAVRQRGACTARHLRLSSALTCRSLPAQVRGVSEPAFRAKRAVGRNSARFLISSGSNVLSSAPHWTQHISFMGGSMQFRTAKFHCSSS